MAEAEPLSQTLTETGRQSEPSTDKTASRFQFTRSKHPTVRARYLEYLEQDVKQRLTASIHAARFLDIGVNQNLNATVPWYYKALEGQQNFSNFESAFAHFQGRVLLLGPPGSGKTTTLLNLALNLIDEAKTKQAADIPLLFNLSTFGNVSASRVSEQVKWIHKRKDPSEENPARLFEEWLVQMLIDMPVDGLNKQVAQQWVNSGNIAPLLDGLDEVTDTHLLKLAEILNETYFRKHPTQIVVVCSRLIDYQPLQENKEARLRLNGAVILQPPTPEQIDEYLEDAQALSLRDALRSDNALYEMAQTPLTLSMMTLAYGGEAPTDIPQDLPFLERRRKLLDTYVERMVQRTARREKGVVFDLNRDNDVAPEYSLDQTNHYLGWLAIKLSERMRTLFPLGRFYSFLSKDFPAGDVGAIALKFGVAMLAIWLIAIVMNAGLLLPSGWGRLGSLVVMPLVAPFVIALAMTQALTKDSKRWSGNLELVIIGLVIAYAIAVLVLLSQSIVSLLPVTIDPKATVIIFLAVIILGFFSHDSILGSTKWQYARTFSLRASAFLLSLLGVAAVAKFAGANVRGVAYAIAIACIVATYISLRREFHDTKLWVFILSFLIGGISAVAVGAVLGGLLKSQILLLLSLLVTALLGIVAAVDDEWRGTALSLGIVVVIANLIGGPAVATLAVVAGLLFHVAAAKNIVSQLFESSILNPALRLILPCTRNIPFRYSVFLQYSTDTMLLKKVGIEYEFVHRLLRDHFAIRELIPKLFKAEGAQRVEIIQRLSRQGDSSFDALASLVNTSEQHVRIAVIEGLGRIGIPKVFPLMLDAIKADPDERVRAAVVSSSAKLSRENQTEIFSLAMKDSSSEVRRVAIIAAASNTEVILLGMQDEAEEVFRQTLIEIANRGYFYLGRSRPIAATLVERLTTAVMDADAKVSIGGARALSVFYSQEGNSKLPLDTNIIPALLAKSTDSDSAVREAMVSALSAIAKRPITSDYHEQIKKVLINALNDKNDEVRRVAIPGLAALGDPETLRALRNSLDSNSNYVTRQLIVELGAARDPEATTLIMRHMGDPFLRHDAAKAIGRIGDQSVVPQLLSLLDQADKQVAAIMAVAELKVTSAVPKLNELLFEPPKGTRRYLRISRPSEDVRPYAAVALGKLGAVESVPHLLKFSSTLPVPLLISQAHALKFVLPRESVEGTIRTALENMPLKELEAMRQKLDGIEHPMHPIDFSQPLPSVLAQLLVIPPWELRGNIEIKYLSFYL